MWLVQMCRINTQPQVVQGIRVPVVVPPVSHIVSTNSNINPSSLELMAGCHSSPQWGPWNLFWNGQAYTLILAPTVLQPKISWRVCRNNHATGLQHAVHGCIQHIGGDNGQCARMPAQHRSCVAATANFLQHCHGREQTTRTLIICLIDVQIHRKVMLQRNGKERPEVADGLIIHVLSDNAAVGSQDDMGPARQDLRQLAVTVCWATPQRQEQVGHSLELHCTPELLAQGIKGLPGGLALLWAIIFCAIQMSSDEPRAMGQRRFQGELHAAAQILVAPGPVRCFATPGVVHCTGGIGAPWACVALEEMGMWLTAARPHHALLQVHHLRITGRELARGGDGDHLPRFHQEVGLQISLRIRLRQGHVPFEDGPGQSGAAEQDLALGGQEVLPE
mmetsp:Transcript_112906/g.268995  ORF Transcript_112906/g.268995 Transcript_112906/m.268995 type:complete len:391 (-) Transcript_112906:76-1248(-)